MKMFCEKCGAKLTDGQQFCPNCGEKIPVYCPNCRKRARVNDQFCIECGALLEKSNLAEKPWVVQVIPDKKEADDAGMAFERYRNMLSEKSRLEKLMLTGTSGLILILSGVYYINNPGEDQLFETFIMGGIFSAVLLAIYGLVAGNMGVYEATKYLKQYDTIKNTVGEKEAVLFIEKEYHPELSGKRMAVDGMKMTAGGAKVAGGCFMGCLQAITGFAASIIAVILAMAFC